MVEVGKILINLENMSNLNLNSGYGQAQVSNAPYTTGRLFVVAASWDANFNDIDRLYQNQYDGIVTRHATITAALAQCVTSRWDVVMLSPNFTTAATAAELLSAETKWVNMIQASKNINGVYFEARATATLPQSTAGVLFTVTWRVKLISIIGEVTTIIQTQLNNTKLVSNPTVGADVDLCAVLDITADAVWTNYNITGTLANALVATTSWAWVYQAAPLIVTAGTVDLDCSASNTWSVKWIIHYEPIDAWARIFSA